MKIHVYLTLIFIAGTCLLHAQDAQLLNLDRIHSNEFRQDRLQPFQWADEGESYVRVEFNSSREQELAKYQTATSQRQVLLTDENLIPEGSQQPIAIEDFSFSADQSKLLIFSNSSRVWRANTKGDYWIYDLKDKSLRQIGKNFASSSLMFAKFSNDNSKVSYVQDFNLYVEDVDSGEVIQLTNDGGDGIINGTFDWVYEEEFGCRDGFRWNSSGKQIALWNLDASKTGIFYMINNTDSIYSKLIPIQYPKVGEDPSACKVGIASLADNSIKWIPMEGSAVQNYIPAMQWVNEKLLLIQQLNRLQNKLIVWAYDTQTETLRKVYTEEEKTWVDIMYPDMTANQWRQGNDLPLVDNGTAFLRMTETDGWRHLYKVEIETGKKTLLTPGSYDVASMATITDKHAYFHASPDNSTQRYLYRVGTKGGKAERITPDQFQGVNIYNASPNGKYAVHTYESVMQPSQVNMVSLPNHKVLKELVGNQEFSEKLATIKLPKVEFFQIRTEDGLDIDVRMVKPINFDPTQKYPVLFHVYGEPWGQVATDRFIGMWNIMLAQRGYVIIDMDNRGTPCLKGSEWRKSIYRKIGVINSNDQAQAAVEVLKKDFLDPERTAVWGWSGGGSMTLNLLFRYPEIYKTGLSVAPVSSQLIYDNIYTERYMGLPQDNMDDFINSSPVTYAKNLQGNLLVVHGTNDDNVHYQSLELLTNELIKNNKQFQMMSYPNRSHGIYEGENTRKHLFTLLTMYLMDKTPPNETNLDDRLD